MNIKDLNAVIISDVYSLLLQTDILTAVKNAFYINIIIYVSFFYHLSFINDAFIQTTDTNLQL